MPPAGVSGWPTCKTILVSLEKGWSELASVIQDEDDE